MKKVNMVYYGNVKKNERSDSVAERMSFQSEKTIINKFS